MLKVWTSSDKLVKLATQFSIPLSGEYWTDWILTHDPLLRVIAGTNTIEGSISAVASLDPVSEGFLFGISSRDAVELLEVSRPPVNSKVKDNYLYDEQQYGSFIDSIQGFWSILHGDLALDSPSMMHSQHYVRHRTFKGQASTGLVNRSIDSIEDNLFGRDFLFPVYNALSYFQIDSSGSISYDAYDSGATFDVTPLLVFLASKGQVGYTYLDGIGFCDVTLSDFTFKKSDHLEFAYHASIVRRETGYPDAECNYDVSYSGSTVSEFSDDHGDPVRSVRLGTTSNSHSISNVVATEYLTPITSWVRNLDYLHLVYILDTPSEQTELVAHQRISDDMQALGLPFWNSVDLQLTDITALARDTATTALNRLSTQAFEPSFNRIGAINPLGSIGESMYAKIADGAISDAFRINVKDLLGVVGGAGLVKYRTIFSDSLQLINSLEALGALKSAPSRLYVANAKYDYQVVLGGRDCTIHVRSKAYLKLSPFRLIQILVGKQVTVILTDLLALYYSSIPLGEILLTILQLRRIGDAISNRMFYDLPLFFVHVYEVESQLTQAELDDTGLSTMSGDPVRLVYYIRDISRYLPTLRQSNLTIFYSSGDVGNVIWSLLQQLVGVLSSGI